MRQDVITGSKAGITIAAMAAALMSVLDISTSRLPGPIEPNPPRLPRFESVSVAELGLFW